MRLVTTADDIRAAIIAELTLDHDETTAGTYAHNVIQRLRQIAEPTKTSDITGFPEDDSPVDRSHAALMKQLTTEDFEAVASMSPARPALQTFTFPGDGTCIETVTRGDEIRRQDVSDFPTDDDIEDMEIERRIEAALEDPEDSAYVEVKTIKVHGFPPIKPR